VGPRLRLLTVTIAPVEDLPAMGSAAGIARSYREDVTSGWYAVVPAWLIPEGSASKQPAKHRLDPEKAEAKAFTKAS